MDYKDIPGWFHQHTADTLDSLIRGYGISQVIEIGSYLGKSTIFFAQHVLETVAIDPFVMWEEGSRNGDALRDAGDDFYHKFKENVFQAIKAGGCASIKVVRKTSEEAFYDNTELYADLIYIDAAHDYESVKNDIRMWRLRAKKIICGDDYDENWPGVKQAVDEAFGDTVNLVGNFWYVIL